MNKTTFSDQPPAISPEGTAQAESRQLPSPPAGGTVDRSIAEQWTYSWNAFDQLTNVSCSPCPVDPSGSLAPGLTGSRSIAYGYGLFPPVGGRGGGIVWRKATTVQNQIPTVEETRYVQDGLDLLAEIDAKTGQMTRFYVHGPGIDEPLAMWDAGDWYYYHVDHLGSVTEVTDTSGSVVNQYRYSAFGSRQVVNETIPQPFGFTGRIWDKDAQLYNYRMRWYDAGARRFLAPDPSSLILLRKQLVSLWTLATMQRVIDLSFWPYVYASARPVNRRDPTGLVAEFPAGPCGLKCYQRTKDCIAQASQALQECKRNIYPCVYGLDLDPHDCLLVTTIVCYVTSGTHASTCAVDHGICWVQCDPCQ